MDWTIFFQLTVSGCVMGVIYALVAQSFCITFQASKTVNFGNFEAVSLGGLITYSALQYGWIGAVLAVIVSGCLLGVLVNKIGVEPALKKGGNNHGMWIVATLSLGLVLKNLYELVPSWGKEERSVAPVTDAVFTIGGVTIQGQELIIIGAGLAIIVTLELFMRLSSYGKAFAAVSNDPTTASLVGISPKAIVIGAFAASCVLAGLSGLLAVPLTTAGAGVGIGIGLKGFSAAVLGGLNARSNAHVVVAGLIIGISESMTAFYVDNGSGWKTAPALIFMMLILAFRPDGLFTRSQIKKV